MFFLFFNPYSCRHALKEEQGDREDDLLGILEEPLKLAKVKLRKAMVDEVAQAFEDQLKPAY